MSKNSEIQELLKRFESKYNRYKTKHDKSIYDTLDLVKDGKVINVTEFKKIYGDKLQYGLTMLNNVLDKNYIYNVNRRYKKYIEKSLYAMGSDNIANEVREMSMSKFLELYDAGTWDNVKETYDNARETKLAEYRASGYISNFSVGKKGNPKVKKDIYKISEKERKDMEEKLGF